MTLFILHRYKLIEMFYGTCYNLLALSEPVGQKLSLNNMLMVNSLQ